MCPHSLGNHKCEINHILLFPSVTYMFAVVHHVFMTLQRIRDSLFACFKTLHIWSVPKHCSCIFVYAIQMDKILQTIKYSCLLTINCLLKPFILFNIHVFQRGVPWGFRLYWIPCSISSNLVAFSRSIGGPSMDHIVLNTIELYCF